MPAPVEIDRARATLGVDADAEWATIRSEYRRRIREAHPDVAGGDHERATALNRALAVLLQARAEGTLHAPRETPTPVPESPRQRLADDVHLVGNDTLIVDAPPDETLRRVVAGLDRIGEVTYLDRSGPIAEAIVVLEDGSSHSLVVTFQGRGPSTEVFATLEAIQRVGSSNPGAVLRTLARFIP